MMTVWYCVTLTVIPFHISLMFVDWDFLWWSCNKRSRKSSNGLHQVLEAKGIYFN